jgi:hypothetical protein
MRRCLSRKGWRTGRRDERSQRLIIDLYTWFQFVFGKSGKKRRAAPSAEFLFLNAVLARLGQVVEGKGESGASDNSRRID